MHIKEHWCCISLQLAYFTWTAVILPIADLAANASNIILLSSNFIHSRFRARDSTLKYFLWVVLSPSRLRIVPATDATVQALRCTLATIHKFVECNVSPSRHALQNTPLVQDTTHALHSTVTVLHIGRQVSEEIPAVRWPSPGQRVCWLGTVLCQRYEFCWRRI